jgi:hypothetical protein
MEIKNMVYLKNGGFTVGEWNLGGWHFKRIWKSGIK